MVVRQIVCNWTRNSADTPRDKFVQNNATAWLAPKNMPSCYQAEFGCSTSKSVGISTVNHRKWWVRWDLRGDGWPPKKTPLSTSVTAISLAVWIEYTSVRDRRTDKHRPTATTALTVRIASRGKNLCPRWFTIVSTEKAGTDAKLVQIRVYLNLSRAQSTCRCPVNNIILPDAASCGHDLRVVQR